MRPGGTVVRHQARRRWAAVTAGVAVVCAVPLAVQVWPVGAAAADPAALRDRISASARQPFQGYAQTTGALGLPELPRLSGVTSLLSGTTNLRAWYAGPDRWRVDELRPGAEQGLYRRPGGEYRWDYGGNLLTRVRGALSVRLPRAADLLPPDLGRRLVNATTADPVTRLPGRRIAGVAAVGLRIVPADPRTTVGHVDVWAAPGTGLPLQVEVTGRGADRPVLTSRFLEVDFGVPADDVVTPPAPRAGMGFTTASAPEILGALRRRGGLPDQLTGQPRRAAGVGGSGAALYGVGLSQLVAITATGRFGHEAYEAAARYGRRVAYPTGEAAVISTSLLSVLVLHEGTTGLTYLVAGFVNPAVLQEAGADLLESHR